MNKQMKVGLKIGLIIFIISIIVVLIRNVSFGSDILIGPNFFKKGKTTTQYGFYLSDGTMSTWINAADKLGREIKDEPGETWRTDRFLNADPKTFLNTYNNQNKICTYMSVDIPQEQLIWNDRLVFQPNNVDNAGMGPGYWMDTLFPGLYYSSVMCVYHGFPNRGNMNQRLQQDPEYGLFLDMKNIIDFNIVDGKFNVTVYDEYYSNTDNGEDNNPNSRQIELSTESKEAISKLAGSIAVTTNIGVDGYRFLNANDIRNGVQAYYSDYGLNAFDESNNKQIVRIAQANSQERYEITSYYQAARKYLGYIDDYISDRMALTFKNGGLGVATDAINQIAGELSNYQEIEALDLDKAKIISLSESEAILGPFKITYEGKAVESIEIDGIQNARVLWSITEDFTDGGSENLQGIVKNEPFYLKVEANLKPVQQEKGLIKITFKQQELKNYRQRMIISSGRGAQTLAFYATDKKSYIGTADYEIGDGPISSGGIIVNKKDSNTQATLNIGFKVEVANENGSHIGWLRRKEATNITFTILNDNEDENYIYNANQNDSNTTFRTPGGTQTINNLSKGYKYKIWETATANSNYDITKQTGYNGAKFDTSVGGVALSDWLTVNDTQPVRVDATNISNGEGGTIIINKTDATNSNRKLDMAFKVQVLDLDNPDKIIFLDNNTTGSGEKYLYKEVSSLNGLGTNSAIRQYNTSGGTYTLDKLNPKYRYMIWETTSPGGYTLANQPGYVDEFKAVNLNMFASSLDENGWIPAYSNIILNARNIGDNNQGQLTVRKYNYQKVIKGESDALINMSFKIEVDNGQYLVRRNYYYDDYDYGRWWWWDYVGRRNYGGFYYTTTSDFNSATVFETDTSKGTKVFTDLPQQYSYRIWEVGNEDMNRYKLDEQQVGLYDATKKALLLKEEFTSISNSAGAVITGFNDDLYRPVSIKGYVWVDKIAKGETVTDDRYKPTDETGDELFSGVTVTLLNGSQIIASTTTNGNGEYEFIDKIRYIDLSQCYVQFSGYGANKYCPVKYCTVASGRYASATHDGKFEQHEIYVDSTETNGSRIDNDCIRDPIYGDNGICKTSYNELAKLAKTNLYDKSSDTLKFVNLGLIEATPPDHKVAADLKYVKIIENGYEYVYEYGKAAFIQGNYYVYKNESGNIVREITPEITNNKVYIPKAKFPNPSPSGSYDRAVYPSGIYNMTQNGDNKLQIYAVYEIFVKNKETRKLPYTYYEDSLELVANSGLKCSIGGGAEVCTTVANVQNGEDNDFKAKESSISADFGNWNPDGTYKNGISLDAGESTIKYIQYKLTPDGMRGILGGSLNLNLNVTTKATHYWHRYEKCWHTSTDSEGNSYSWYHYVRCDYTYSEERHDTALGFQLTPGTDRMITGNVFNDELRTDTDEILGNGIYDDREKAIEGVTVELVENLNDQNPAKIYVSSSSANLNKYEIAETSKSETLYKVMWARMTTGKDGTYVFEGVPPGKYYLRYTYKDGTTKIVNPKDGALEFSIDNYKSTVVTSNIAKKSLGHDGVANDGEWYKNLEDNKKNIAIDNLEIRKKYNTEGIDNKNYGEKYIVAETALIDVTIENNKNRDTFINVEEHPTLKHIYEFGGFNFGLVKQPEQRLEIHQKITNAKITNSQGNTLLDGNPNTIGTQMPGLTDLDGSGDTKTTNVDEVQITKPGSYFTRMEIAQESIYGSELELTYSIFVTNVSEKNYYETDERHQGWYYWWGEHEDIYSKEVEIDVVEILDCYDQVLTPVIPLNGRTMELSIELDRDNKDKVSMIDEKNATDDLADIKRKQSIEDQITKVIAEMRTEDSTKYAYKKVLSLTGTGNLARNNMVERTVKVTKLLQPNEEMDYLNIAGLSQAKINIAIDTKEEQKAFANNSLTYVRPLIEGIKYIQPDGDTSIKTRQISSINDKLDSSAEKQYAYKHVAVAEMTEATVIPPTGSDVQYKNRVYAITGIVTLIILITGIIIIKKKVL